MHRSPWFRWLLFATVLAVLGLPGVTVAEGAHKQEPPPQAQPAPGSSVETTRQLTTTVTLDDPLKRITDMSKLTVLIGRDKAPLRAPPVQDPATGRITLQIEVPAGLDPSVTGADVFYDDKRLQSIPFRTIEAEVFSDYIFGIKVGGWPEKQETIDSLKVLFVGGADPKKEEFKAAEIVDKDVKGGVLHVRVKKPEGVSPGWTMLQISQEKTAIADEIFIPGAAYGPDQQPALTDVSPRGGTGGTTITVTGLNFGTNLEQIKVRLYREDDKLPAITTPLYISSADASNRNQQTLRFEIPRYNNLKSFLSEPADFQIEVAGRLSDRLPIALLHSNCMLKILGITLAPMGVFLLLLFVPRFRSLVNTLFIESHTATYSLSKTQAFLWTLILMGSYLYLAIGNGLVVTRGTIPDFNASLLGLMSISYGGLITSSLMSKKYPKNEIIDRPASWMDLISEGGHLSLPRIQLAGFTLIAAAIYVYNMKNAQLAELPEVPPVLQGLMGVSQIGYLAGHAAGQRIAVNLVLPRWIRAGEEETITLIGTGFVPDTKALFEGETQSVEATLVNESTLSLKTPKFRSSGEKKLFLLPPARSLVPVPGCVHVLSPPALVASVDRDGKISCTLANFPPGDLVGRIGGQPVILDKIEESDTPKTVVRRVSLPAGLELPQEVVIETADGRFAAKAELSPQTELKLATG